ncbi:FAD/NAD(P)-binding protein [Chryseobacterium chendengshani]|uniref:FAD/NAD(P)-binding protein n=1 Tax=Chryseobacterium sp. LJ756 TaxID=2864113 RepID=UPI001C63D693|nr:FAD/NAD(P)-binding protein [Chryseobacterium sp. LJ756]MBW7676354.1 FAD/NAD(P)-binding protein [Chryseobacterium sp. LJ756]
MSNINSKVIALIGGGPAALFLLKHIITKKIKPDTILIFEKNERLGTGMPYGQHGSGKEHVANVSANELPELLTDIEEYIKRNEVTGFPDYSKDGKINRDQVIPRLLLGDYLENQFEAYIKAAKSMGIKITAFTDTKVIDIIGNAESGQYSIITEDANYKADTVILCTGHYWSKSYEDRHKGWYDSPYPPSKFNAATNHPVAVKGASLTAVDIIKTLSRINGTFNTDENGHVNYTLHSQSENFSIDLYSLSGFLPALRFHSEDEAYSSDWKMTLKEIYDYKKNHGGFVDLDYVFNKNFKLILQKKDPEFYDTIKDMNIEDFVDKMMKLRKELDSFELFKAEYAEAEKSIKRHQSISWKEALTSFSYAMNYPAKHFSAEDMLRLNKVLMPLISIIIAALPQSSYREIIALYDAGVINLNNVDAASTVTPYDVEGALYQYKDKDGNPVERYYKMYVDATGQRPLNFNDLPFDGLKQNGDLSTGYLNFKNNEEAIKLLKVGNAMVKAGWNENYYMQVKGLSINDYFQALDAYGKVKENLYIMAVAFIGGLNPDYSGLDFCDTAGETIVQSFLN